ncbi:MAG: hypothetical protein AAFZ87_04460 [Planctomycetota bacterium]
MTSIFLRLNGRTVRFTSLSLERRLDAVVGTFSASLPMDQAALARPGARALVSISGDGDPENLLVGFVDRVDGRSEPGREGITITGRDRTADLADGVQLSAPTRWENASLLQLARDVALPFGVTVEDFAGAARMRVTGVALEPGQPAYRALERAARQHGVLLGTTPDGALALGAQDVGVAATALRTGPRGNVAAWGWTSDHSKRFRRVRVRGQTGGGFGDLTGLQAPESVVEDPEIRGQRELDVVAQGPIDGEACERLGAWHVSVRRARAFTFDAELPAWRQRVGAPAWRPGLLVEVEVPAFDAARDLLVSSVRLEFGDAGERAALGLIRPETLERDPSRGVDREPAGFGDLI